MKSFKVFIYLAFYLLIFTVSENASCMEHDRLLDPTEEKCSRASSEGTNPMEDMIRNLGLAEQREQQSNADLWDCEINVFKKCFDNLHFTNLNYGGLLQILLDLEKSFERVNDRIPNQKKQASWELFCCLEFYESQAKQGLDTIREGRQDWEKRLEMFSADAPVNKGVRNEVTKLVAKDLVERMNIYKCIKGTDHPHWNMFSGGNDFNPKLPSSL